MNLRAHRASTALLASILLASSLAACGRYANGSPNDAGGGSSGDGTLTGELTAPPTLAPGQTPTALDQLTLRLVGEPNARFQSVLAADDQKFWAAQGLEVTLDPTGPDPEALGAMVDPTGPQAAITSTSIFLRARATNADLVAVAQLSRAADVLIVSPASKPIKTLAALKGKTVGAEFGTEVDLLAAAAAAGVKSDQFTVSSDPFDPAAFVAGGIDAVAVTRGDGYAQILEQDDGSGQATSPSSLHVLDLGKERASMTGDLLVARASWLKTGANLQIAARLVAAIVAGAAYCRDAAADCAQLAVDGGATLPLGHQRWLGNETNAQAWPAPAGLGAFDEAAWAASLALAKRVGIDSSADGDPHDVQVTAAAATLLAAAGVDTTGSGWTPDSSVVITLGGQ